MSGRYCRGMDKKRCDFYYCRLACGYQLHNDRMRCSDNCKRKFYGSNCITEVCRYNLCVKNCKGNMACKTECFYSHNMGPRPKKKVDGKSIAISKMKSWRLRKAIRKCKKHCKSDECKTKCQNSKSPYGDCKRDCKGKSSCII